MTRSASSVIVIAALAAVLASIALAAQDKYTVRVPNGLAFSEFRGIRKLAGCCCQSDRKRDQGDRRESRDDQGLQERHSR
jgi:hypothetical protein